MRVYPFYPLVFQRAFTGEEIPERVKQPARKDYETEENQRTESKSEYPPVYRCIRVPGFWKPGMKKCGHDVEDCDGNECPPCKEMPVIEGFVNA